MEPASGLRSLTVHADRNGPRMTNPFAPTAPAPQAPTSPSNPFGGAPQAPTSPSNPFGGAPQAPGNYQPYAPQAAAQPQAAPPAAPLRLGTFAAPKPPTEGGASGAQLPDMWGRLVLILPHKFEPQMPTRYGNQDTITATVVVLDGANPMTIGAHKMPPDPNGVQVVNLPYVRKNLWIRQTKLIEQTTDHLPGGAATQPGVQGMVLGRLMKDSPAQNDPWYLVTPTPADEDLGKAYLRLVGEGRYPSPLA